MSDDEAVAILKAQHRNLDESVHSLAKETAHLKDMVLTCQKGIDELKDDTTVLKAQMVVVRHDIAALNTRFDKQDDRMDQQDEKLNQLSEQVSHLEMLILQLIPNH